MFFLQGLHYFVIIGQMVNLRRPNFNILLLWTKDSMIDAQDEIIPLTAVLNTRREKDWLIT